MTTTGPTLMQAVQERLASPNPRDRIDGCLKVLALTDVRRIEQILLESAQRDSDAGVRHVASRAIALVKEWTAVGGTRPDDAPAAEKVAGKFLELLTDQRPKVRLGALTKVLKYKDRSLLPLVEEAMQKEQNPAVLAAMLSVLGQLGHERYLSSVCACLYHPDARVAAHAVAAAGQLGRDAVTPLITGLLEREDAVVLAAVLEALRPADPERVWRTLDEWAGSDRPVRRAAVMSALAQIEDQRGVAIARKVLAAETDEDVKQAAEEYVARTAPPGALTAEQLAKLRNALGSPDAPTRTRAIDEARPHLAHPEVRALVQVLGQLDPHKEVQKAAKAALEEDLADLVDASESAVDAVPPDLSPEQLLERTEKVQAKFRTLLSRRQEVMRMKAVLKAKKYKEKTLLPVILERMETEASPVVLATMLATMADLGSDEHVPLIAPYLAHGNYRVVNGAVLALHRLGGDDVLPLFLPLLTRDDPRIQSQALVAVMRLNAEQLLAYVRQMAASSREGVRGSAITCLSRIPLPDVEEIAREMLERETADANIQRLVALLGERAGQRSAGPLWALKNKRPELERSIHGILEKVVERSGISTDDIRAQGADWEKSQAALQLERERELAAKAAQRRTTRKEAILMPPPERGAPPWLWAGGLIGIALFAFNFIELGESPLGPGGGHDGISRLQERVSEQVVVKPVEPDAPISPQALAAEVEAQIYREPKPTKDEVVAAARQRLVEAGYQNSEFIEMEARSEWREAYAKSYEAARELLRENDVEGAIRVLEEALAATEPENLLVRKDLMSELEELYVRAGKADKAKDMLRKSHELVTKILAIRSKTKNPFAPGNMATDEDVAQVKAMASQIDAAVDQGIALAAAKEPTPEEERQAVKADLEARAAKGEISASDVARQMAEYERDLAEEKERERQALQAENQEEHP